eukprot:2955270-Pleurochrysis_carterae.AAC.1
MASAQSCPTSTFLPTNASVWLRAFILTEKTIRKTATGMILTHLMHPAVVLRLSKKSLPMKMVGCGAAQRHPNYGHDL